jgi:hypothetical protein
MGSLGSALTVVMFPDTITKNRATNPMNNKREVV